MCPDMHATARQLMSFGNRSPPVAHAKRHASSRPEAFGSTVLTRAERSRQHPQALGGRPAGEAHPANRHASLQMLCLSTIQAHARGDQVVREQRCNRLVGELVVGSLHGVECTLVAFVPQQDGSAQTGVVSSVSQPLGQPTQHLAIHTRVQIATGRDQREGHQGCAAVFCMRRPQALAPCFVLPRKQSPCRFRSNAVHATHLARRVPFFQEGTPKTLLLGEICIHIKIRKYAPTHT